ncbi:MAG: hypothetical protein H7259_02785 [Cytophagales bacterium]|nr:hypothetical protein [Cytophaga sp.]
MKFLLILIPFLFIENISAQIPEKPRRPDYLSLQTGFVIDGYNSMGIRTFFEYQKDLKNNWQYGISYEHTSHFGYFVTDRHNELPTNLSVLNVNAYYKLNAIKDRLFWTAGLGTGLLHINWDNSNKVSLCVNASLTLNIRITKKLYIETAPFFPILPINRCYFSTVNIEGYNNFFACAFFPIGIKVKL